MAKRLAQLMSLVNVMAVLLLWVCWPADRAQPRASKSSPMPRLPSRHASQLPIAPRRPLRTVASGPAGSHPLATQAATPEDIESAGNRLRGFESALTDAESWDDCDQNRLDGDDFKDSSWANYFGEVEFTLSLVDCMSRHPKAAFTYYSMMNVLAHDLLESATPPNLGELLQIVQASRSDTSALRGRALLEFARRLAFEMRVRRGGRGDSLAALVHDNPGIGKIIDELLIEDDRDQNTGRPDFNFGSAPSTDEYRQRLNQVDAR